MSVRDYAQWPFQNAARETFQSQFSSDSGVTRLPWDHG